MLERGSSDACDAERDCDALEIAAIIESATSDASDARGDSDIGEPAATGEREIPDACDGFPIDGCWDIQNTDRLGDTSGDRDRRFHVNVDEVSRCRRRKWRQSSGETEKKRRENNLEPKTARDLLFHEITMPDLRVARKKKNRNLSFGL